MYKVLKQRITERTVGLILAGSIAVACAVLGTAATANATTPTQFYVSVVASGTG